MDPCSATFLCGRAIFGDIEECELDIKDGGGVRAGWVMCDLAGLVAVADNATGAGVVATKSFYCDALALATVPGLGLMLVCAMTRE